MNSLLKLIIIVLIATAFKSNPACCQNETASSFDAHKWVEKNFSKNHLPPFSFIYGGRDSRTFITSWEYSAETKKIDDPNCEEYIYSYRDKKTALAVKCFVTCYKDYPVVEWVLKFSNTSNRNSLILEKAKVIDYSFTNNERGPFVLYHSKGSNAERSDFQLLKDELIIGKSIYMTPAGGRSSDNTAFPFFNIETSMHQGVIAAVGWTGKWYADVQQTGERSFTLKSGMEKMQLYLYPKEEIRTPRICLLFWQGEDRMTGHNQFRQFILAHHTRMINGKPAELPFSVFLARNGPPPCNEHSCATENYATALIYRYQQFNIVPEVFWIDAGWYTGCGNWSANVGNWTVNKNNFPNGLKPVSDVAHKVGAKFLLWFEPERVVKGTKFYNEHHQWMIEIPDSVKVKVNHNVSLFDLGNPEARLWLTGYISDMIKREGINIYRQDFNMDPYLYWDYADKPQRTGISEIRHIEGLYAFWDSLLVRFPNLIIDNCASGGRRIDLETVSRSSPFWRTDYNYGEPNGYQCHTFGLNYYLPLHGTCNTNVSPYYFLSSMSSTMVVDWDIGVSNISQAQFQKFIADFKRLRPFYYGDYYPLTPNINITSDNIWLAYQLNRPIQNDGIIIAFRRQNSFVESVNIKLRGLENNATYELFYEDYGIKVNKTGAELMQGLDITIPTKPASLLISYRKLPVN